MVLGLLGTAIIKAYVPPLLSESAGFLFLWVGLTPSSLAAYSWRVSKALRHDWYTFSIVQKPGPGAWCGNGPDWFLKTVSQKESSMFVVAVSTAQYH